MQKATVIDFQEFRRRREAQRRQPSQTAQSVPMMPMMPIVMWYPIQWVWTWPVMPASAASAMG